MKLDPQLRAAAYPDGILNLGQIFGFLIDEL